MRVVYVAGPYRSQTREGIELNIQSAKKVGTLALERGWSAMIPHMNTAHMDAIVHQNNDKFWLAATMELMRRCDAVVLCPGWQKSAGTLGEIHEAVKLGMPIYEAVEELPCPMIFVRTPRLPKCIERAMRREMVGA